MGTLKEIFDSIARILTWWIVVQPWEQGLRVRMGKHERNLTPGLHFKIPIIDLVYVQTDRLRMVNCPLQTLTTKDGVSITVSSSYSYSIVEIRRLYHSLYHPELTLTNKVSALIADHVANNNVDNCKPSDLQKLDLPGTLNWGLSSVTINIIGYAIVRTYRLISGNEAYYSEGIVLGKDSAVKP